MKELFLRAWKRKVIYVAQNWGRTGITRADDGYVEIDLVGAYITFTAEIQNEIELIIRRLGREMLKEIEEKVPDGEFYEKIYKGKRYRYSREYKGKIQRYRKTPRRTPGTYKKNWKVTFTDRKKGIGGKITATAHQKGEDYRLVHLLELGHKMPHGKDYKGNPIIAQIQDKYRKKVAEEIRRLLAR